MTSQVKSISQAKPNLYLKLSKSILKLSQVYPQAKPSMSVSQAKSSLSLKLSQVYLKLSQVYLSN